MGSEERIVELLTSEYGVDPTRISREASLAQLGLNSLTVAELTCDLEELFGIRFSPPDTHIITLGDAVVLVDRLRAEQDA